MLHEVIIFEIQNLQVLRILRLNPLVGLVLRIDTNGLFGALLQNNRILYGKRVAREAIKSPLLDLDRVPEGLVEAEVV
jgi:hypothetical protein